MINKFHLSNKWLDLNNYYIYVKNNINLYLLE